MDGEKQTIKDKEEDKDIDKNVQKNVASKGDLSPRQLSNLKSRTKKNYLAIPLQVRTRSSKDSPSGLSQ